MNYVQTMTNLPIIRIGTRKSPLALAQANLVADRLRAVRPGLKTELVTFTTEGDRTLDQPLADIGGKGLFTKELEDSMLAGDIHIAVHSMKDMPTVLPEGLVIGAILEREDPRDVLIANGLPTLFDLPPGASFGTSSLRRAAQVKLKRPDLKIVSLRGNVQTRLDKLSGGDMQATMLAQAGLNRLGLNVDGAVPLAIEDFLPAIAQGAIGIECRQMDGEIRELLALLSHMLSEQAVACERAFLSVMDGSCRTPIAGYARIGGGQLQFSGLIARPDGMASHEVSISGSPMDAAALGREAGAELKAKAGPGFLD